MISLSLILHAFHAFRSRFWVFDKIWDGCCLNEFKTACIALHYTCIITMFHAFRYVFTLLLCYVLVGLDWAEFVMHLNLHVTCSCIFMHTYLQ